MSELLRSWQTGAAGHCRWIDFDAYARTVFAGGSGQWLTDPARRAAALEQAQKVVASQVLTIDLLAPFLAAAAAADGGGAATVTAMLENTATRGYLETLLDAVSHRLARNMDLVVAVPSPRDLLVAAGGSTTDIPDFNDLDDVGTALTDLARALSSKSVQALLINVSAPALFGEDEAEAAGALVAAVRHFGWSVAVATPEPAWPPAETFLAALDADLYLFPEAPLAAVLGRGDRGIGGGLGEGFWSGAETPPADVTDIVLYGRIPAALSPEQVLARLAALPPVSV